MVEKTKLYGNPVDPIAFKRPQFFAWSALIMMVIVVLSFPLTYYLPLVKGSGNFDTLHHLHGLTFFAWIGLYVWQTWLVARGQIGRHREIGLIGFALTGLIIPLGFWMAQRGAQRRLETMVNPYEFTWFNLADMTLFSVFMIAAILLVTRHKEWHRRFAFVAALCLVAPAATRWTLRIPDIDPFVLDIACYLIIYPFLIALAMFDWRAFRKLHPATLMSIVLLLPVHVSSAWIARSVWWNTIAPALIGQP
ncbi:hypothetical protein SAMN04488104_104033 [Algoriphagus faecimaris]|uniref:Uncharacterized protein n=1 Tax=Algoriphagus faecimaris TaxID=686796 RepID=A0A1G6W2V1_9BACT|nr:hypothetical protein [Algoriphagus faecimaris]SDD60118.1 hypothetical protein SAMN04488104_104033 [Algoriphagus faecimaris]